jgi:hypothetical protein
MNLKDCVGNTHAYVVAKYSSVSARCACGETITLRGERYVHHNGRTICPPYECACGRRH